MIHAELKCVPRTDYKDQMLNDIAEIVMCDIVILKRPDNIDIDEYCEEEEQGEAEKQYLENLRRYVNEKKDEISNQYTSKKEKLIKISLSPDVTLKNCSKMGNKRIL